MSAQTRRENLLGKVRVAGFGLLCAHLVLMVVSGFSRGGFSAWAALAAVLGTLAVPLCTWEIVRRGDRLVEGVVPARALGGALRCLLAMGLLALAPGVFAAVSDAPLPLLGRVAELSTAVLSIAVATGLVFLGLGVADLLYAVTARARTLSRRLMVLLLIASLWTLLWLGALGASGRRLFAWAVERGHLETYTAALEMAGALWDRHAGSLLGTGALGFFGLELPFTLLLAWRFGQNATRGLAALRQGFLRVAEGDLETPVPVTGNDEVADMQRGFNEMLVAARERRFLETAFGRYVSPVVLERIKARQKEGGLLAAERRVATVLFSDIRGFTALSAELDPEEVIALLNCYLARMIEAIARYDGYINKFVGDGVMVIFGAPLNQPDHALRALVCAAAMQEELEAANRAGLFGKRRLEMGIGLNTGPLVAGSLGNERQTEFTVIGDTVNVASRACSVAAAGQVALTLAVLEAARAQAKGALEFEVQPIGKVDLKGKGPTELFALKGQSEALGRALSPSDPRPLASRGEER